MRWRNLVVLGGLVVAAAGLMVAPGLVGERASAAPSEPQTPVANPDLQAACGLDILVILDESGSILNAGAVPAVRQAFTGFTNALQNTGSRMAVAEFNYEARLVTDYTEVTTASKATLFDPYIDSTGGTSGQGYNPQRNDRTNWEDGLRVGRYFAPPPVGRPHLTVFITDGLPNTIVNNARVTYSPGSTDVAQNEYELKQPLDRNEVTNTREGSQSAKPAIPNANALKASGSHVLAVAVGEGLNKPGTLDTLRSVSGPDVYDGTGTAFDIRTDDVFRVSRFDQLESSLREAAFQLCAPSVNVQKLVDTTPDPGTDDAVPAAGWTMTADVAHPNGFTWVSPPGATGTTASAVTNAGGFANFQWTPNGSGGSTITVTETDTPGTGFLNDVGETECQYRTPDQPSDQPLTLTASGDSFFSADVPEESIVTCSFLNRALPAPAITLEKSTNGADADVAPGPSIPVGAPVTWRYVVTNTGNVTLDIALTDAPAQTISCPLSTLAPGASTTCTATGTATSGQYANTATVTGTPTVGDVVTATDPSHYTGVQPGIDVEKSTNGDDADAAPGPFVAPGSAVDWEYVVTNTGPVTIDGVQLVDDRLGPITCPDTTLQPAGQPGDSTTCTANGTAIAGQYSNLATVTGDAGGTPVSDSDPSHYFGEVASIDVEKSTNGDDADDPTGPTVAVGSTLAWTYQVQNTGNVAIVNWLLTDDRLPTNAIACPQVDILQPGQIVTCIAAGTAVAGQYANLANVEGTTTGTGTTVGAEDPSHYLGVSAQLVIEKSTNGQDADGAPGALIETGDPVTWTYEVSMIGTDQVADVAVTDLPTQTITPVLSSGFNVGDTNQNNLLEAGETWQFTANGTAATDQYTNLAAATGRGLITGPLYAYDPSNYFGVTGGIDVEKATNGLDADLPTDAPLVALGDPVDWTYRVLNTSNTALGNITVNDDQGVAVTCPQSTLAVGEQMTCTATGTATIRGLYTNLATATGVDGASVTQTDTDPSHYRGYLSALTIEKSTNGVDADTPPGPFVAVGAPVTWTYTVTAEDLAVRNITVTDDQGVVPQFVGGDTDGDDELDPDETWTYEATGTAVAGPYANLATVEGVDTQETALQDQDPSHYYGTVFRADVGDTATNLAGDDHTFTLEATYDDGTGPASVPDGSTIAFTWTGDGQVSEVNGAADPDARSCVVTGGSCTVTVSSATPGSGDIAIVSVAATVNGTALTGVTTTVPPGLVAAVDGSLTASKTWVSFAASVEATAVNLAGDDHTFTLTATFDDGTGPVAVPDGSVIAFSWVGDGSVTAVNGDPTAVLCTVTAGSCTVTVSSASPGSGTITIESVTSTIGGDVLFDIAPGTIPGGSQTADKTWVELTVGVAATATNLTGDDHVFTLTAVYDDGTGPQPANGASFAYTWSGAGTAAPPSPCVAATDANTCEVTVSSDAPGTGTITIDTVTATVNGATFTDVTAAATTGESLTADKTWIDYRIGVDPREATNLVGDPHTFTVTLEVDRGSGFGPAEGEDVQISTGGVGSVIGIDPAGPDGSSCTTDADGQCEVTVNSEEPGELTLTAGYLATAGSAERTVSAEGTKTWTPKETPPTTAPPTTAPPTTAPPATAPATAAPPTTPPTTARPAPDKMAPTGADIVGLAWLGAGVIGLGVLIALRTRRRLRPVGR